MQFKEKIGGQRKDRLLHVNTASEDGYPTWGGREKSAQLMDAHKRLSSHHRHNHDELTIYPINSSSASIDIVDGGASKTFNNHNVKFDFELQSRLRKLSS